MELLGARPGAKHANVAEEMRSALEIIPKQWRFSVDRSPPRLP